MGYKVFKSTPITLGDQIITEPRTNLGFVSASLIKADGTILNRIEVTGTYTINHAQYFIGVQTHIITSSVHIYLPKAETSTGGRTFIIKDEGGMSDTNNIIVHIVNGDTVDGEQFVIIESPYASLNVYTDGVNRWFVY
jgi:hypothetical protein